MIAWLKRKIVAVALARVYGAAPEAAAALAPKALRILADLVAFHNEAKAAGKSEEEAATEAEAKVWRRNDPDRPNTAGDILNPNDNV